MRRIEASLLNAIGLTRSNVFMLDLFARSKTACLASSARLACLSLMLLWFSPASAYNPATDPKGFLGIPWGADLSARPDLVLVEQGDLTQTYEMKDGPPLLGDAKVDTLRFQAVHGKFGRVIIRYRGQKTHDDLLTYLQSMFGPVDQGAGPRVRRLNQQYTWRGPDTEASVIYESAMDRGHVFIESRTLAPRFNDFIPDQAY